MAAARTPTPVHISDDTEAVKGPVAQSECCTALAVLFDPPLRRSTTRMSFSAKARAGKFADGLTRKMVVVKYADDRGRTRHGRDVPPLNLHVISDRKAT